MKRRVRGLAYFNEPVFLEISAMHCIPHTIDSELCADTGWVGVFRDGRIDVPAEFSQTLNDVLLSHFHRDQQAACHLFHYPDELREDTL